MVEMSRYWPTIIGVPALALTAFFVWPDSELADDGPGTAPGVITEESGPESVDRSKSGEMKDPRDLKKADRSAPLTPSSVPEDRVEIQEVPRLVKRQQLVNTLRDFSSDDPEVKQALAQVRIEMYEADWCPYCRKARAFFKQNSIAFQSYDVDADVNMKERARRLSGGTGIPVIVVDGEVSKGFSEAGMKSLLISALKKRLQP